MKTLIAQNAEERLDVYLASATGLTRSYIKQLIDTGAVTLNGQVVKGGKRVAAGDKIDIDPPQKTLDILPQNIPLDIIYQDKSIAVINKQAGLSVHPAGRQKENTLVNALLFHLKNLSSINGVIRPGIVHRLDKDTTGVILVAKTDKAHLSLSRQLADRKMTKIYWALLEGVLLQDEGVIENNIARHPTERQKMAVVKNGRQAISHYKVLKRFANYTLTEFNIKTGRTHQIRVHAKHMAHPVVGDKLYGYKKQKFNLEGQLLHAHSVTFTHPDSGKKLTFAAPPPPDFAKILDILK